MVKASDSKSDSLWERRFESYRLRFFLNSSFFCYLQSHLFFFSGQKKYVCNRCLVMYESPNPLKLHITLGCGKYGISTIWKKLSELLNNNSIHNLKKQESFSFKLSPEPQVSYINHYVLEIYFIFYSSFSN